jgi:hypothetical protein
MLDTIATHPIQQIHEVCVRLLYAAGQVRLIVSLKSPYLDDIEDELDRLKLQLECAREREELI